MVWIFYKENILFIHFKCVSVGGYGCQSAHIIPSLTPFRDSTASGMESKLLSLDWKRALHPSFCFSLVLFLGSLSGQTSVYCDPRTDLWPCPPLMLSPLPGILPLLPLSLLPSMSHSKPTCELLFILQDLAPSCLWNVFAYLGFSVSCLRFSSNVWWSRS